MKKILLIVIPAVLLGAAFILTSDSVSKLTVTSPAFGDNDTIPMKYTCEGTNVNPQLSIEGIPEKAKSLAVIVDDPDGPQGTLVHWLMWNIPVTNTIAENSATGVQGINVNNMYNYAGPCPAEGSHRYRFRVFALNQELELKSGADKVTLQDAMESKILGQGELIGTYKKKNISTVGTK